MAFSKSSCLRSLRCSSFGVSSDADGISNVRTDDKIRLSLIILILHARDTHRAASNETGERNENTMADNSAGKLSKISGISGLVILSLQIAVYIWKRRMKIVYRLEMLRQEWKVVAANPAWVLHSELR